MTTMSFGVKDMNSAKTNGSENGLPPALSASLETANSALIEYDRLHQILADTHHAIPQALSEQRRLEAEAAAVEIAGGAQDGLAAKIASVIARRETDARRRHAALDAALALQASRETIARARQAHMGEVIENFQARWQVACRGLAELRAEAEELSKVLKARVECPPPYQIVINRGYDRPELRLVVSAEGVAVTLPPQLTLLMNTQDKLDEALNLCGSIKQARQWDKRHYHLAQQRGEQTECASVYKVREQFRNMTDGLDFQAGQLVDRTLVSDSLLGRLSTQRRILPVDLAGVSA
jgi:hypothetical protein